jgi:hypothetical protein
MEKKHIIIPKIEEEIRIDGNFNEPVWGKAAIITPFTHNDGTGVETEPTRLRICYNSTYLYLGWSCTDSDIQATLTQHDANLWDEEVVECFITPHRLTRYFELQWNPLGTTFDGIILNTLGEDGLSRKRDLERDWNPPNIISAVVVEGRLSGKADKDKEWRVEAAIPFAELETGAPRPGDVWRANFYRYNRTSGKETEFLAWSPTCTKTFHEPNRFGFIQFGE